MGSPINAVRYLKRENAKHEQLLILGYFRELIQHYGVDVDYFRLKTDFFADPSGSMSNYVYGESTTSTYETSAPMIVYMKVDADTITLKGIGIETSNTTEVFFAKQDYTETFRDLIGDPASGTFETSVFANISGFSGLISGSIVGPGISGMTSAYTIVPSGHISGDFNAGFTRYPLWLNPDIVISVEYTDQNVIGNLSGSMEGVIDASGNGSLTGNVSGNLYYFREFSSLAPNWDIAPQVGDFIRMKEWDADIDNYEEYEITEVTDRDISTQGINPLLKRYIWKCTVVRRNASKEVVMGSIQEERLQPQWLPQSNWEEIASNEVFDYENKVDVVDGQRSDNIYGGYSYKG